MGAFTLFADEAEELGNPMAQVGVAAAAGADAVDQINADLIAEETRQAVAARRNPDDVG
ncbi:hypothetical protein [Rhizohabitans arisaemae]|uniref:hypothetical protein n=1 Tax=Rhizohabitans arisaemae TaxID=2720610 RepID=UPI0024B1B1FF|nr:hypothetical protein [Rhizohabitans arisaemae]